MGHIDLISATEGKIAFLRHTYENTKSRTEFLYVISQKSCIEHKEAGLAWDIFDYLAWENADERYTSHPPLSSEDPETDHGC